MTMDAAAVTADAMGPALVRAAGAGNAREAKRLLDAGAPVDWRRPTVSPNLPPVLNASLLRAAAGKTKEPPFSASIAAPSRDRGSSFPQDCRTALQMAAANGQVEVAALLLHHGADLEATDHVSCIVAKAVLTAARRRWGKDGPALPAARGWLSIATEHCWDAAACT